MTTRLLALAAGLAMMAAATTFAAAQSPAQYCQSTFESLKAGIDKYGKAIQSANKRKAKVTEACSLFNSYVSAEAKMMKFMKSSQAQCGIPEQAIKNINESHAKSVSLRTKICNAAKGGGSRPPSAGLSSALGLNDTPSAYGEKPSGVFDTLNGNVLK
jgi:hypothetical protein